MCGSLFWHKYENQLTRYLNYGLQINAIALININSAVKYFVNILVIDATDTPRPESAHFARSEFPAQLIMYKMRFILNCLIRIMPLTTTT